MGCAGLGMVLAAHVLGWAWPTLNLGWAWAGHVGAGLGWKWCELGTDSPVHGLDIGWARHGLGWAEAGLGMGWDGHDAGGAQAGYVLAWSQAWLGTDSPVHGLGWAWAGGLELARAGHATVWPVHMLGMGLDGPGQHTICAWAGAVVGMA
jgi:hypothetical protein